MFFKRIIEKNPSEGKNGEKKRRGTGSGQGINSVAGLPQTSLPPGKRGAKKSGKKRVLNL